MASGTKLILDFYNAQGKTVQFTYNYAKTATAQQVTSLMQGMITNGSIFANPPVEIKGAKLVTTTEQVYDLSSVARMYSNEIINGNPEPPEGAGTIQEIQRIS